MCIKARKICLKTTMLKSNQNSSRHNFCVEINKKLLKIFMLIILHSKQAHSPISQTDKQIWMP